MINVIRYVSIFLGVIVVMELAAIIAAHIVWGRSSQRYTPWDIVLLSCATVVLLFTEVGLLGRPVTWRLAPTTVFMLVASVTLGRHLRGGNGMSHAHVCGTLPAPAEPHATTARRRVVRRRAGRR